MYYPRTLAALQDGPKIPRPAAFDAGRGGGEAKTVACGSDKKSMEGSDHGNSRDRLIIHKLS